MEKVRLRSKIALEGERLVILLKPWQKKWFEGLTEDDLLIEFRKWSDKRSLGQNALMWALIGEIDLKENGRSSEDGEMTIYKNVIKRAKIRTFDYEMNSEAYEETKRRKIFRVVEGFDLGEGQKFVRCYPGTSTFDKKEMADFLEGLKDYASRAGVNLDVYEGL